MQVLRAAARNQSFRPARGTNTAMRQVTRCSAAPSSSERLERRTRRSLKEHIFHPAKMPNTLVYDEPQAAHAPKVAISYAREGSAGFPRHRPHAAEPQIVGDEGVFLNIDDLFRWEEAASSAAGSFPAASSTKRSAQRCWKAEIDKRIRGFGWGLAGLNGHPRISHSGAWVGFRTDIARFPQGSALRDCGLIFRTLQTATRIQPRRAKVAEIYLEK